MSADIVPLGGKHRSPQSMLAEIMSDDRIKSFVIVTFTEPDGLATLSHYEMTRQQMAFASVLLTQKTMQED